MTAASPQTILITGATSGIGRFAALYLARLGHRVFATGRNQEALRELTLEGDGSQLSALRLDVTDPDSIEAARLHVDEMTSGRGVDVLINNAGYGHLAPLAEVSDADLRRQFDTNVFGLMAVTRAFLPAMRARRSGRILNVSSVGGRVTFPFSGAYSASKYALESISDALRVELKPFGIDVILIEPGPIKTEFGNRSMEIIARQQSDDSPYAPVYEAAQKIQARADQMSVGPDVVVRAIARAIEARRPAARYVAPFRALLALGFLKAMPSRLSDAVMSRVSRLSEIG
jgi:NAD(P)-dependent dehydrogenase (short-subunit alcohol dehydrogenase family)